MIHPWVKRNVTPSVTTDEYIIQNYFHLNSRHNEYVLNSKIHIKVLRIAHAIGRRLVYSDIGVRTMATALAQPDERLSAKSVRPEPLDDISSLHPDMMSKVRRSQFTRNVEIIVSTKNGDDDAWVEMDDPLAIFVKFTNVDRTAHALEEFGDDGLVYLRHQFFLGVTIAHEYAHSLRQTIEGAPKMTPPSVRSIRREGKPTLRGGTLCLRGEGGFFLERCLLGGEINMSADPEHPLQYCREVIVEVPRPCDKKADGTTSEDGHIQLPDNMVRRMVLGERGWDAVLPWTASAGGGWKPGVPYCAKRRGPPVQMEFVDGMWVDVLRGCRRTTWST